MSRTYRKYETHKIHVNGKFYDSNEYSELDAPWEIKMGWQNAIFFEKQRDSKPWYKPNKAFKKVRRRKERAEAKDAMRKDKPIPKVKKNDIWDWT